MQNSSDSGRASANAESGNDGGGSVAAPELNFWALFECAPDAYLVLAPDPPRFTILAANEARRRVTMTQRVDVIGQPLFEAFPDNPTDPGATGVRNLEASLNEVLRTKQPNRMSLQKYDIRTPGGDFEERYWEPYNSPVFDAAGELIYLIHRVEDVTEQVVSGSRLRVLESVVTTANDAVIITEPAPIEDPGPKIIYVNAAFTRMTGYEAAEAIGKTPRILQGPDTDPAALKRIHDALNHEEPIQIELLNYRKDGTSFWLDMSITPVRDEEGRLTHWASVHRDTTERREAEESERRLTEAVVARDQLEALLNNLPDLAWMKDRDLRFVSLNDTAVRVLGLESPRDAVGKTDFDLFPREVAERFRSSVAKVLEGEQVTTEDTIPAANGTLLWVETIRAPIRDARGEVVGLVGIARDISRRKRAEEAQQRLIAIFEGTPDVVMTSDTEGNLLYMNRAGRKLLGVAEGEVGGRTIADNHPAWAAALILREGIPTAMRDGTWEGETAFLTANGAEVPVSQVIIAHRENGELVGFFSTVARDITERKRVEAIQRIMAEAGRALVITLDVDKTIENLARCVVPRMADFCIIDVLAKDGTIRRKVAVHKEHDIEAVLMKADCTFSAADAPVGMRYAIETGQAELVPVVSDAWLSASTDVPEQLELVRRLDPCSIVVAPLTAGGRTFGAVLFASTIPERRYGPADLALGEELAARAALAVENARLYAQSQQATLVRDQVLRVVAHDLRNPLNTVSLSAELLGELTAECERDAVTVTKQVEIIRRSVRRANRLIEDLLDAAKMQAGMLSMQQAPDDAARIVDEALELHHSLAEDKKIELRAQVATDLPPISVDHHRILQVFSNVIGNAIRFTPDEGRIVVGAEPEGKTVRFSVADTGVGIPEERREHLFDPFWQADRGSREGTGLGLAISKGIVESHGGRIWLESEEGKGTTFFFTVPIEAPAPQSPPAATK